MRKVFIYSFFGPPGSGKGTLSGFLKNKKDFVFFSTGNLCRKHIAEESSFGEIIGDFIKKGVLIPDDIITNMTTNWIIENIIKSNSR